MATQTLPTRVAAVQASGCRERLSLPLPGGGQQGDCLPPGGEAAQMVAGRREKRVRGISMCEQDTAWWSNPLVCQGEGHRGMLPEGGGAPALSLLDGVRRLSGGLG